MHRLRSIEINRPTALRIGAVGLAILGLAAIASATQRSVTLLVDGTPRRLATHARTVDSALRDAGVRLAAGDQTSPSRQTALSDGAVIEVHSARPVRIQVSGRSLDVISTEVLPENILAQAGIRLFPGDRVWADGLPASREALPPGGPTRIRVDRAVELTLDRGNSREHLSSAGPTLGAALWEAGIRVRQADRLFPGPGTTLGGPTGVRATPARSVLITGDGTTVQSWASGETVGEALADAGIGLTGMDRSEPSVDSPVPLDGRIKVIRVVETAEIQSETLPFGSGWAEAPEVEIDRQRLLDPGEAGLVVTRTRVRYEDGQEVGRSAEPSWVAVEPRDRTMGYGTKVVVRTLDAPGGPIEYWRAVTMYATSYHPCGSGVPGCLYGTASGARVGKGIAAVTVPWFLAMRGQRVYVPGYGVATIADTGGGVPWGYWIDLAYGSAEEYVSWHQWVTVYFLTPVPPEGAIPYVLP